MAAFWMFPVFRRCKTCLGGMIQQYRNGGCKGRSVLSGLTGLFLGQMASLSPEQLKGALLCRG